MVMTHDLYVHKKSMGFYTLRHEIQRLDRLWFLGRYRSIYFSNYKYMNTKLIFYLYKLGLDGLGDEWGGDAPLNFL